MYTNDCSTLPARNLYAERFPTYLIWTFSFEIGKLFFNTLLIYRWRGSHDLQIEQGHEKVNKNKCLFGFLLVNTRNLLKHTCCTWLTVIVFKVDLSKNKLLYHDWINISKRKGKKYLLLVFQWGLVFACCWGRWWWCFLWAFYFQSPGVLQNVDIFQHLLLS